MIRLRCQPSGDRLAKFGVVHEAHEDLFVLVYAFHKEGFEQVLEDQFEFIAGVDRRGLL